MLAHRLRAATGNAGGGITFVGQATNTQGTFNVTIDVPSGTQSGDELIAVMSKDGGSATWTPPTGWTELYDAGAASRSFAVMRRTAPSSPPSSYTFTQSGTGNVAVGLMAAFRNCSYDSTASYAATTNTTTGSITVSADNSWLIVIGRCSSSSATISFPDVTELSYIGDYATIELGYKAVNSGATGTISGTLSGSNDITLVLALNPL